MSDTTTPLLSDEDAAQLGKEYDLMCDMLPDIPREVHFLAGITSARLTYEPEYQHLLAENAALRAAAQVAADALAACDHCGACDTYDLAKMEVIGEPGTGPWDTELAPAPCTCGKTAALTALAEQGVKPTQP